MDAQEGRKVGPHTVVGLDGEDIRVVLWDKGSSYGVTYFSHLHSDCVIMTHNDDMSHIHFADSGMGVYGLHHNVISAEAAKADVEHVFYNLVKRLNRVYRTMCADQGIPLPVVTSAHLPVMCEERG